MENEGQLKPCSLFLVNYVPDLVRDERLNIGLLLHSPEEKYLGCLFTDDFRRVKRFHPKADLELLRELQQHFEQEIDEQGNDLEGYLRRLQESCSNLIQLSPPRVCLLRDPQTDIQDLFARYVGARTTGPPPEDTRLRIKQRLTAALVRAGIWARLDKRIAAEPWTHPGDPFTFDFGYRPLQVDGRPNGHIKFIHALSLKRDAELAKVLVYTLERVRAKEPAELAALVEGLTDPADRAAQFSRKILEEARIQLQPISGADEFARTVRSELLM